MAGSSQSSDGALPAPARRSDDRPPPAPRSGGTLSPTTDVSLPAPARLRALLAVGGLVVAPGVFDGVSARLVEMHGFGAAYVTGAGAAASLIGAPDIGLVSQAEMVAHVGRLVEATSLPLVVDADTGYGGIVNVTRTVRSYERAGAAALHIEDQTFPKRCGHLAGKQVIPAGEFLDKLAAALDARRDDSFVVIARTDARAPLGIDEALDRACRYAEAGADLVFVDALLSVEEMERVAATVPAPLMVNMIANSSTPMLSRDELEGLGYRLAIYPLAALAVAARAMEELLTDLCESGTDRLALDAWGPGDLADKLGLRAWLSLDERHGAHAGGGA